MICSFTVSQNAFNKIWPSGWLTDWLMDQPTDQPTDWLIDSLTDSLTHWLSNVLLTKIKPWEQCSSITVKATVCSWCFHCFSLLTCSGTSTFVFLCVPVSQWYVFPENHVSSTHIPMGPCHISLRLGIRVTVIRYVSSHKIFSFTL